MVGVWVYGDVACVERFYQFSLNWLVSVFIADKDPDAAISCRNIGPVDVVQTVAK